jgi:lipopolysaccharide cholinephosphotransferase
MTENELLLLQEEQKRIMDVIHQFCVENNIVYYMIGGTLLGAVRHKGFIPWDIDIDIAMPRADYEKFIATFFDEKGIYACNSYHSVENYPRPHMEVHNKKTHIVSKFDKFNKSEMYRGIFVDIFPLDNVPCSDSEREAHAKLVRKYKMMLYYKQCYFYQKENVIKSLVKKSMSWALFAFSKNKICTKIDMAMRKYENDPSSGYICSMASRYSYKKQTMPREYYGKPILMQFDDRQYYAPAKSHEYLTQLYGDYMTPPTKKQQVAQIEEFETIIFE